ncbi:hypothetical protein RSOL_061470 [Rhizoctonia solani AG-3 Rhs1AP]|nr:hypothetical protein RSOL_061470 [Rhizoctonia solani AG-3 Rhs1AP]
MVIRSPNPISPPSTLLSPTAPVIYSSAGSLTAPHSTTVATLAMVIAIVRHDSLASASLRPDHRDGLSTSPIVCARPTQTLSELDLPGVCVWTDCVGDRLLSVFARDRPQTIKTIVTHPPALVDATIKRPARCCCASGA